MKNLNNSSLNTGITDHKTIPSSGFLITTYTNNSPGVLSILAQRSATYTYFGPFLSLAPLPEDLIQWEATHMQGDLLTPLKVFMEWVHSYITQYAEGLDYYWFEIRATKGSDSFVIPRWHTDGIFFEERKDDQWKLATCILGPGTLFLKDGVEAREIVDTENRIIVDELDREEVAEENRDKIWWQKTEVMRKILARKFEGWQTVQPRFGEVALFKVGSNGAAVHSEPNSLGDRVFISVLPGTEAELRDMAQRWGMPWSRALE